MTYSQTAVFHHCAKCLEPRQPTIIKEHFRLYLLLLSIPTFFLPESLQYSTAGTVDID